MSRYKPMIRQPHRWLPRAIKRANQIAAMEGLRLHDRESIQRTAEWLPELRGIPPDGHPDCWKWIVLSVRLEGTCSDLGIARNA